MTRILLFQPINYQNLLTFFLEDYEDYKILGSINYDNLEAKIHVDQPDIVLLDVSDQSGLEILLRIKRCNPSVMVVILTANSDPAIVLRCLKAGANGYLLKSKTSLPILLNYMNDALSGGVPISSLLVREVVQELMIKTTTEVDFEALTKREIEILRLLVSGMTYKGVSFTLNIALDTVRSHIKSIYSKLKVNSKSEAVVKALKTSVC